jgi:hypothetical protein
MADYKLGRRAPECAATGKPFAEGEEIISAVFLEDDGFARRDYSVEGFQGVTDHFSFWRAHVPVTVEDERRLDYDLAFEFFQRLRTEEGEEHAAMVYLLALLLGRKRRIKLTGFGRGKGGEEVLNVVVRGDEEDEALQLTAPPMGEGDAARLQADLNRLFGIETAASEPGGESEATVPDQPAAPDAAGPTPDA